MSFYSAYVQHHPQIREFPITRHLLVHRIPSHISPPPEPLFTFLPKSLPPSLLFDLLLFLPVRTHPEAPFTCFSRQTRLTLATEKKVTLCGWAGT